MKKLELAVACLSVFGFALATATSAQAAGTLILEGSDAIGLHCSQEADAGACTYENQVWHALDGGSGLPIAAIGDVATVGSDGSGITVDNFADVASAGSLSQYAALYFISTGGCCTENDSLPVGNEAAISAYLSAGGTVMIENYIGGAAWDFAVGTGGAGNGHVIGVGGGLGNGTTCDDGEMVTATGLANGFTQPPPIGCWEHQGYDQSFFAPLGFTLDFYDAAPGMSTSGGPAGANGFSGLLSTGVTLSATPEPASFLLIGVGLTGLGLLRRRITR